MSDKPRNSRRLKVGQVVFHILYQKYVLVHSTSYPYKSEKGYFVVNSAPAHHFRALTAKEKGR